MDFQPLISIILYFTSVAKCTGGDSCCSEDHQCGVGEGDCDSDADCEEGLLCGTGNCPSTRSAFWDADDDCCYKPGNVLQLALDTEEQTLNWL